MHRLMDSWFRCCSSEYYVGTSLPAIFTQPLWTSTTTVVVNIVAGGFGSGLGRQVLRLPRELQRFCGNGGFSRSLPGVLFYRQGGFFLKNDGDGGGNTGSVQSIVVMKLCGILLRQRWASLQVNGLLRMGSPAFSSASACGVVLDRIFFKHQGARFRMDKKRRSQNLTSTSASASGGRMGRILCGILSFPLIHDFFPKIIFIQYTYAT